MTETVPDILARIVARKREELATAPGRTGTGLTDDLEELADAMLPGAVLSSNSSFSAITN